MPLFAGILWLAVAFAAVSPVQAFQESSPGADARNAVHTATASSTVSQEATGEQGMRVSLLTILPGSEIYSLWGHSALRITDPQFGSRYDLQLWDVRFRDR